jgi:hypothetical protein
MLLAALATLALLAPSDAAERACARATAAAKDRSTLLPYFLGRYRAGDRLRIVAWKFNSRRARDDEGGFEFTLRRRARGYRGGRWFTLQGKGSVACARRQISVVSLGGPG